MIGSSDEFDAISRRGFMQRAACAAAATTLAGLPGADASAQSARGGQEILREFPYGAVRLTGGAVAIGEDTDYPASQPVDLPRSLSPLSSSGEAYRTVIAGRDLVFVPYFTVDTEKYNTYFRIA